MRRLTVSRMGTISRFRRLRERLPEGCKECFACRSIWRWLRNRGCWLLYSVQRGHLYVPHHSFIWSSTDASGRRKSTARRRHRQLKMTAIKNPYSQAPSGIWTASDAAMLRRFSLKSVRIPAGNRLRLATPSAAHPPLQLMNTGSKWYNKIKTSFPLGRWVLRWKREIIFRNVNAL